MSMRKDDSGPVRRILLLRHAKAESDSPDGSDHARPLAATGLIQAETLGKAWKARLPWPERILCSDARRTRETMDQLCLGAGETPVPCEPRLYNTLPGTQLSLAQATEETVQTLLLIGHNPTMHQTAAMFSQAQSFSSEAGKWLMSHYPPCTLTVLRLPQGMEWAELAPASLKLEWIHAAKEGWIRGEAD